MIQVRLGAQEWSPALFRVATTPVGPPPDDLRGVIASMSIGCVHLNLYAPIVRHAPTSVRHLELAPRLAPYLPQIWPLESAIVRWPPLSIFTREEVERLWPGDGHIEPSGPARW